MRSGAKGTSLGAQMAQAAPQVMQKSGTEPLSDVAGLTVQALREATELAGQIDDKLFGPELACGGQAAEMPPPPSLESQLDEGRVSASRLVKRLSAILERL